MKIKPSQKYTDPKDIMKEHYKDLLVEAYGDLDLIMKRIEWQDADGILTGIGQTSGNEEVARQSSLRDMNRSSDQKYNLEAQQYQRDVEFYSSKIREEGGTDVDIEKCRVRATEKERARSARADEIKKSMGLDK